MWGTYYALQYENYKFLLKQMDKMYIYIKNNRVIDPQLWGMSRYGEPIYSLFVESTINEVIAKLRVI
ncbi:hypothetical protein (fragment) [Xenorhabdus bovienii SS-2004]|uniref:Uncharacterized protein n=1 Tax=Xenorhabdus bovienii (strain SS-2004) TaxID=406818 RepID=D3V0P8_XENBS